MRTLLALLALVGLLTAVTPRAAGQILATGLWEDDDGPVSATVHPGKVTLPTGTAGLRPVRPASGTVAVPKGARTPASTLAASPTDRAPPA
jgi:hypothetical protein